MKKLYLYILLAVLSAAGISSCTTSEWDSMPERIQIFIDKYFNSTNIESFSESNGHYVVVIRNGCALTFDSNYSWTIIDGRGGTLPQLLISDQLPEKLYNFLFNMEVTNRVYELDKTSTKISVKLTDTYVEYDISSQTVSYPDRPVSPATETEVKE